MSGEPLELAAREPGPSEQPPPELTAGSELAGRYRIETMLGAGASGAVFRAEPIGEARELLGSRQVALKVIHRHLVRDYQIFKRFHREAKILRKLTGPYVVPVLDFGEALEGQLYMALELVRGEALDVALQSGPMEPRRAVRIVVEICEALSAAHAAGVVHRDLKPGNVLLDEQAGGRARVLDFGMAKLLQGSASTSLTALTESNMVFGTPEYMAPEQARGDEVDERADVYAAGIILYELLTGSVPFKGNTPISTMTAHLVEELPPPSSRSPERLPRALEAVVTHALAKDPRERYPDAGALAEALRHSEERPSDVESITPPPLRLAHADTELELEVPAELRGRPRPRDSASGSARAARTQAGDSRTWIVVSIVAALLGIAAGVGVSLL